jgi:hypothetical protein
VSERRYTAVSLRRGRRLGLFRAAIEDARDGTTTKVANASMAECLAELMNAVDAGRPLPAPATQHHPTRFQLQHGDYGPRVGVVYVHARWVRVVADAPDEETAKLIARVLRNVDYPMIENGALSGVPGVGEIRPVSDDLPEAMLEPQRLRLSGRAPRLATASIGVRFGLGVAIFALFGLVLAGPGGAVAGALVWVLVMGVGTWLATR